MAYNYFSIEDSKLRWTGDLEELKYFVANELKLTGKWTSPGGDVKAFSNDNDSVAEDEIIKIKWSQGKKILTILGSKSQEIEWKILDEIQKIAQISMYQSTTSQTELQYLHNQKLTEAINEIKVQIQQLKVHTKNNQLSISKLMTLPQIAQSKSDNGGFESHKLNQKNDELQVANESHEDQQTLQHAIKRLDSLTHQFQKHQTETSIVITELLDVCETRNTPTQNDHILRKNTLLKETNEALKAELLEYKSTITQINAKLTTAENEIASLLTVIRVLNEDRAVTISPKRRKEIISPSRANSDVASASQPVIIDHNVSLNNRYSCLDTENGDKASRRNIRIGKSINVI